MQLQYRILFQPMGLSATIDHEETILQAAQRAGVSIEAYCGSQKKCGKCRVKIVEGILADYGLTSAIGNTLPLTDIERQILGKTEILDNYRLACVTKVKGDVAIEIPVGSKTDEQVILKRTKEKEIDLKPAVKTYYLELDKATLEDHQDDASRVKEALKRHYQELDYALDFDFQVLKTLPQVLRAGQWKITVTILYNKKIIKVERGNNPKLYGMAIDVGTTTVAAYLCDLGNGQVVQSTALMNPQIQYGDDVLTRISHCMNTDNGVEVLRKLLLNGLNELVEQVIKHEGIESHQIVEAVVVWNTVMQHIGLGIHPEYLGQSPFVSAVAEPLNIAARDFGINILPSGNIHCLPSEAGFIGSDNVAVLISEEPYLQDQMKLIVDIGTNSEICLGNREKLYTTSCATGPALEGAQIQCGMRAAKGAIEAVEIDPVSLIPKLKIIGSAIPHGICGSGIIDVVSQMAATGIIEPDGKFSKVIRSDRIRYGEDGKKEYVLYYKNNAKEKDIVVTQKDVRAVQLAKAALYAGAKVLLNHCGIDRPDQIVLAGAFGSYIQKENALKLGLFPDCLLQNISVVGNAAGLGARMALINCDKRKEAQEIAKAVEFVETATRDNYSVVFSEAMTMPHKKDAFTMNQSYIWPCSGNDSRTISQEVFPMGLSLFEDADVMEKALLANQKAHQTAYMTFPLIQKIEASAYGCIPEQVGEHYSFNHYPYTTIEEIDIRKAIVENPWIKNTLTCLLRQSDRKIVLEVTGPFSILATLVNPTKLYTYKRKNKDLLMQVLNGIADALADYAVEALKQGADILSFADPEGVTEIVGEGFYKEISGAAVYRYLKKIEPYLDRALVHICGKSSYSLQKAGYVISKVYRAEDTTDYIKNLFELAISTQFRFIGHQCIHVKQLNIPMIHKLELR